MGGMAVYGKDKIMKKLTGFLLIFSSGAILLKVVPVLIFGFKVIEGTGLCLVDFLDLLIWAPFVAVIFFLITRAISVERGGMPPLLLFFIILAGAVFFEGHGIHFAANAISNFSRGEVISEGLSRYIYFYDENLGHWLIDLGFYALLFFMVAGELTSTNGLKDTKRVKGGELVALLFSGVLFGFYAGSSALESQTPWEVLIYFSALIIVIAVSSGKQIVNRRFSLFMTISGLVIILAYIIYYIKFGGLIEPSEWM